MFEPPVNDVAALMLRLFNGRDDRLAVGNSTSMVSTAQTRPLTPDELAARHLSGRECLAFYPVLLDDTVRCSCLDFDNKPRNPDPDSRRKTRQVARRLVELGLPPLVELSQSGTGAHTLRTEDVL